MHRACGRHQPCLSTPVSHVCSCAVQAIDDQVEQLTQGVTKTLGSLWGGAQSVWQTKVAPVVAPLPPSPSKQRDEASQDPDAREPEAASPSKAPLLSRSAPAAGLQH